MRVLVVEDARPLADVIAEGLRDQGMAVDVAHDGLDAAAKLDVNAYDVVVLDRDLPGIHDDTLCQMITKRDGRLMVPILTAADSPSDRASAAPPTLGADDYLTKPFHFPELILHIHALAPRRPATRSHTLNTAGIEHDPIHRTTSHDSHQRGVAVSAAVARRCPLSGCAGWPGANWARRIESASVLFASLAAVVGLWYSNAQVQQTNTQARYP
ncbi:response regulator transcription factor [Streptomyces paradoxus]|uniref:response regulator transcription factor n=1 Tax=Streptomyces paradoxus TaxID=66375 RepID=UPI0037D5A172